MRHSEQRNLIIEYLDLNRTHPTSNEIFTELKKMNTKIGFATVYRNLKQLEENQIIKKIITPDEKAHYDIDLGAHYHFICNQCNKIVDLKQEIEVSLKKEYLIEKGLHVTGHDLVLYGKCKTCQNKLEKEQN